jgi:hypothetical protein
MMEANDRRYRHSSWSKAQSTRSDSPGTIASSYGTPCAGASARADNDCSGSNSEDVAASILFRFASGSGHADLSFGLVGHIVPALAEVFRSAIEGCMREIVCPCADS